MYLQGCCIAGLVGVKVEVVGKDHKMSVKEKRKKQSML
jgi:hypothetical protein